jgi:hypothetical protein
MAATLANEVRAVGTPAYCSACFNQDSSKVHIDMDAACDRGYGDDVTVNMDDLVLCENCVKEAAVLIGWRDAVEVSKDMEVMEENLARAKYLLKMANRRIGLLEELLRQNPGVEIPPDRRQIVEQ